MILVSMWAHLIRIYCVVSRHASLIVHRWRSGLNGLWEVPAHADSNFVSNFFFRLFVTYWIGRWPVHRFLIINFAGSFSSWFIPILKKYKPNITINMNDWYNIPLSTSTSSSSSPINTHQMQRVRAIAQQKSETQFDVGNYRAVFCVSATVHWHWLM